MCRSIKTLRPPYADEVTDDDVHAAALQYVRKVGSLSAVSEANRVAVERAVRQIADVTEALLVELPERIDPPVIQPLDLLLDLSGEAMRERLFAVQGEDGSEACLRPDFTIPVARHLVEQGALNDRWYYQGQAFRIAPAGAQASHPSEFLQIGIEVFGGPDDASADAEIATLAWESEIGRAHV